MKAKLLPNNEANPEIRHVTFNIVDDDDNAITGASIDIDSSINKTTGSAGGFSCDLTDGEHTITINGGEELTFTVSEDNVEITIKG